ncbi:NrfD/PsrC family molybdoenzyme membrane anchor subunit [Aurantimonas sp. 22II-16-19i]|uniref:NrfD/PsrC family molybdoenzyme membrane anchor subunit n=1 Tax=Aurantimonas sp. 22II-16-19i TaxID=1317114 RepID=UPI0009F7F0AF|nr:NrfD/PsrC family molybdoenzyme membrane anchor subunit [Aurantimonas sp. 22II-16-19i]ORE98880.1 polysulfide reductase NrfD [Aurantimonas sp. 22II-16-19i]
MSDAPLSGHDLIAEHGRTRDGLMPAEMGYRSITDEVAGAVFARPTRLWMALVGVSFLGVILLVVSIWVLLAEGVGIWGINSDVVWGYAVANYVWWIGIGNAGTLISSMLLLTRQKWRASINRYAEAMTLFAASIAGLFPLLHVGRPWLVHFMTPYPNTMDLWPQWRSPLVWDMFAIACYILFSLLFWYTGLIPDLATLRDRAKTRFVKAAYGLFALGWTGSSRQWRAFDAYYYAMAALGVPLVISIHSVVGLDYAATLMPGWQETIFPPYFVVGAMFSGFAMVVTLTIPIRWGLGLEAIITRNHLDAMAKIMLFGGLVMTFSYSFEWFNAWYTGNEVDRTHVVAQFTGQYWWLYWLMLACNGAVPQLFWFRLCRRNLVILFIAGVLINLGMWLERILINMNTLSHGFLPATDASYAPTFWDWSLFLGSFGLFCFLFFLFAKVIPTASIHEIRELAHREGAAR